MSWGLETSLARYSVVRCWRGSEQSEGLSSQGRDMADIREKGWRLYCLCASDENKFDEIRHLLDDLSEDERRQVVNYKDEVSES